MGQLRTHRADRLSGGRRADYPVFRSVATRWMDNDVYGHVNNVSYYSFFDTAVNASLIDEGLLDPATSNAIGLVVETSCRYFAPVSFPEVVEVGMRVAKVGMSSVRYQLGIFKLGEDLAAAEGHFVHVYVDSVERRPIPIPDALRLYFERLVVDEC
jgi:acyl-CoA thioester hydrolase